MAKKKSTKTEPKKPETVTLKITRHLPATMITEGDYYGASITPGSQRTVPADVAERLVKGGHAEKA